MLKPEEAWELVLSQAVKAIERGMMWSDDFGKNYHSIIRTDPEYIQFRNERESRDSARSLIPQQVIEAAKKLNTERKVKVGKLLDDQQCESLFVLLHPYVTNTENGKYIKIRKRFRGKEGKL